LSVPLAPSAPVSLLCPAVKCERLVECLSRIIVAPVAAPAAHVAAVAVAAAMLLLSPAAALVSLPAGVCLPVLFTRPHRFHLAFLSSCACCFANKVEAAKLLIIVLYILFYWPLLNTHIAALKKNVAYF